MKPSTLASGWRRQAIPANAGDQNSGPVVPLESVINYAGVTKVSVVDGAVARSRAIKAGRVANGMQEILEGLRVGERVVVSGHGKLFEGAAVKVREADEGHGSGAGRPEGRAP